MVEAYRRSAMSRRSSKLVMAAASLRSDTVYTSDLGDLQRLLDVFPMVELAAV